MNTAALFAIALLAFAPFISADDRVNITVYYESDCPFSRRFLVQQLRPTFPVIQNMVNVQLVPFGFADFINNGDSWQFKCQHGLGECEGNKLHACALQLNSLQDAIEFIGCIESAADSIGSAPQCAQSTRLNWKRIEGCANSKYGSELLHEHGVKTKSVKGIYGVPYIEVNGIHSAVYQHQARRNLLALVCRLYHGAQKPPSECSRESTRSVRSVEAPVIDVTVFYESLCPFSKDFLVHQMYPSFLTVPEIFTADLVPFGHANFTPKGESWTFQCQHGPQECIGNMIQACVLHYYPDDDNHTIPFVHCVESGPDPVSTAQQCAEQNGIDWDPIQECYTTDLGPQLLHDLGVITLNQTDLTSVPWILIDGVHTADYQSRALLNLKRLLCDLYQGPLPPACGPADEPQVILAN